MIRFVIGYVVAAALCAGLILWNPMDFMGQEAREARLKAARDAAVQVAQAPEMSLEMLVADALRKGETERVIGEIVNQAVAEGKVEVPPMLRTTDGTVDTAVLLAAVQTPEDEFGQGDLSEPTALIEGGTLAMRAATEDVLYVVRAGDSLGALALRFYGDAGLNGAIFKANRQVMDRPDSLRVGMKLLIPARSGL